MADTFADLVVKIGADARELNEELEDAKKRVSGMSSEIAALANKMALAFAAVSAGIIAVGVSVVKTAAEFQALEYQLTNVYKSAEKAKEMMAWIRELAITSPFDVKGLTEAAIKLEVLGNDAKKFLPIAQDLAAYMGKDVVEATQAFSRALSGSPEGFQSLREGFGITSQKLKQLGAEVNDTGGMVLDSVENIKKAGDALTRYITENMGGSATKFAETFQGKLSTLEDSITNLKAALGESLVQPVTGVVVKLTDLVNVVNELDQDTKNLMVTSTLVIGGMSLFAVPAIATIGWIVKLSAAWIEYQKVLKASHISMATLKWQMRDLSIFSVGASGAWLALAAAASAYALALLEIRHREAEIKWEMEQKDTQNLRSASFIMGIIKAYDLMGESTESLVKKLKEFGITSEQVQQAILGLQTMWGQAAGAGVFGDAVTNSIDRIRLKLKDAAVAFTPGSNGKTAAQQAEEQQKKQTKESIQAIENEFQQTRDVEEKGYEAEKAMREKILVMLRNKAAQGIDVKEETAKQEKLYNNVLAKIYKENISNLKESFGSELNAREDYIQRKVALNQMDEKEQQKAYMRIGEWIKKFKAENAEDIKKNPSLLKAVTDAEQKIIIDSYNARKAENTKYFSELQKHQDLYLTTVKNTNKNSVQSEIDAVNQMIENYRLAMKKKPAIAREALQEIAKLEADVIALTKQREDQSAAIEEKRLNAAKEAVTIKIDALAKELEAGRDTSSQILQLVQDRLKLEFDLIDQKAKREIDSFGNTEEAKKAIMLETANFKAQIIKQEIDYIKGLIKSGSGDLQELETRLKALADQYDVLMKNGKTPEGAQMKLGVQQINEAAAYLKPVQGAADKTAEAINSLGYAATKSAGALAGSYGYSPTGGAFKQLSGFGTGTGGAFPSMSGFSNWIPVSDINIPGIDMSPTKAKGGKRNLFEELSRPNYGMMNPDSMQPSSYYPATEKAKAGDEEIAAKRAFADALRKGTIVQVQINGKTAAQASIGGAGAAAVASAATTNYSPTQATGLDGMPSLSSMPSMSGYGNA